MPKINLKTVELYYTDQGAGDPIIFVSGLGATHECWDPIAAALRKEHRVITLDNRGIGETAAKENGPFSINDMSDDILSLMDELNLDQAYLAGHSMGTAIAMTAACRAPARISKLILIGSIITLQTAPYFAFKTNADLWEAGSLTAAELFRVIMPWLFSDSFLANDRLVQDSLAFAESNPPPQTAADFKHQLQALKEFDASPLLKHIHQPTLIISGEQDIATPLSDAEKLVAELPDAIHSIIQSAHCSILEQPQVIADLIAPFIR